MKKSNTPLRTKYLTIYKDYVVRESLQRDSNHIDQLAVIKYQEYQKFNPSLFPSKQKYLKDIYLWESEEMLLSISNGIDLTGIVEKEDSRKKRNYYKEIHFRLRDTDGNIAEISELNGQSFVIPPEKKFCYDRIQKYLLLIKEELAYHDKLPEKLRYVVEDFDWQVEAFSEVETFDLSQVNSSKWDENIEYIERRTFGEFSGTYAQDVAGFSDEDIHNVFDGEPELYWNID